jgi:4-hydroxybenzoate polyprenyltransferase
MALGKLKTLLDMIKFEHTIFALPFAYIGMMLGAGGLPSFQVFCLVTIAMASARSFSMALNRLQDFSIDKKNPRTAMRALPAGLVSAQETRLFIAISLAVFFIAVFMLPSLCHRLWPVVLVPMTFYALTKRFTWACHFVLGLCLGLAPMGAWVATTNTLPTEGIWMLSIGVMLWTAGFDILYSCQDYAFDRKEGLHSVPVRFGIARSLLITKALHGLTVIFFSLMGFFFSLGLIFYAGLAVIAGFLWYENSIVKPHDLSRLDAAFFTMNGFVSILAFAATFASVVFHQY